MSLSDLIRKPGLATAPRQDPATVATVATVAEASPGAEVATVAPDPRLTLYRAWLAGITEARVFATLNESQVREAVAAGIVTREVARACVLLLVRLGGAGGLLAIPKERWATFGPADAITLH